MMARVQLWHSLDPGQNNFAPGNSDELPQMGTFRESRSLRRETADMKSVVSQAA